jgi:DNA-binding PucR family transcriptional regulator
MKIGEKIKELRRENNMTQEQLADYLCVSYQAVSKWETGISNPDLSLFAPLTKLFRVSADELLGLETETDKKRRELEEIIKDLREMILISANSKSLDETNNYLLLYNSLDNELRSTVECFLENSLNVSETARKLFIHRNTLVFRLDKIKQLIGLDLRYFEDAVKLGASFIVKKSLMQHA